MGYKYFSDRQQGPRPRISEDISEGAWGGIVASIRTRVEQNSFAAAFPEQCPDSQTIIVGTDIELFKAALIGQIPNMTWPLSLQNVPPTLAVLDLLEFCYENVAEPLQQDFHDYFRHYHLQFDHEAGQISFRDEVTLLLARNGIAYDLGADGHVTRLAPTVLREALSGAYANTGDQELDQLLEAARSKFLDPNPRVRRESLDKLWDAWERLKTLEIPGKDQKKQSLASLLAKVSPETEFRERLNNEARALTDIGNDFNIRHHETHTTLLQANEHVDYLFHRLFALINLLLRASNRGA